MKMSKSIKDYKDAMDSIRISDSFYKRTETLLNELPEEKIEKNSFRIDRKITAVIMAAAACFICAVGIRTVLNVRKENMEMAGGTDDITVMTIETTEATSAPELIDIIEEGGVADEMMFDDDAADIFVELQEEEEVGQDTAGDAENDEVSADSAPISGSAGTPIPTTPKPASGGGNGGNGGTTSSAVKETEKTGYPEISVEGTDNIPPISDIDIGNVTVEITPYFDMENISSGENAVIKSGIECSVLIEVLGQLSESSYKIPNGSFKSLFSVQITDNITGAAFYSIYITDSSTMIVTRHNADSQQRQSFALTNSNYGNIKHMLFIMFGTEADYELFENLVSGK